MALSSMGRYRRLEHVVAAAGLELVRALGQGGRIDQALVGEQALEGVQPALVVACGLALALGVGDLGDQLRLELAPLEAGVVAHRHGHAEDAALPRLVEHELAVLARQRGGAGHVGNLAARYGIHRRVPSARPARAAAPAPRRTSRPGLPTSAAGVPLTRTR